MTFNDEIAGRIVARANLAPSVHNTQPARWRFEADGAITVLADETRFLTVSDPSGRDTVLSCGAAVEGTIMALADCGLTGHVENIWQAGSTAGGPRPVARIVPRQDGEPCVLSNIVEARSTWRGKFEPANDRMRKSLTTWTSGREDVALASSRDDLEMLARLNDEASLRFYRCDDYRDELLNWMRLTRSHPGYDVDGLNLEALHLGSLEGHAAKLVLGTSKLFRLLDLAHVAAPMLSEREKTLSSTAVVVFHRPLGETAMDTGRVFYRLWLELARMGYAAWPMAALADDPETAAACAAHFRIDNERRLINFFRVGVAPHRTRRARHGVKELILREI